jgi:glutaredoxin 3
MKRFFTVYIKTDCPFCKKAIELLEEKALRFVVVVMDKNPEFIAKVKQDMKRTTVPIIIEHINAEQARIIGGSDDLENYLNSPEFAND